ncbi:hypothetical protein ACFY1L_26945 [Streptomyces sp. NPDC001663]|uniref:hypothetical protein n=1 Tax=Streptomyces sp. NPDC001663 TaxID=3364597 RepID=UPI0036B727B4
MLSHSPDNGSPSRLERIRHSLSVRKPRIAKWLLAFVAALGFAAEIIEPLGNALKVLGFLGASFAAFIALILFDAIGDSGPKEISDVYVLTDLDDLNAATRDAFQARHVRIDFSGFSMETLLELLKPHLNRLASRTELTQELTLNLIVTHLNLPQSRSGNLELAPESAGHAARTEYFRDSPENRDRIREEFTIPNWGRLKRLLDDIYEKNPHIAISCEVRESPQVPERKLYILNQEKVFSVPYGMSKNHVTWHGNSVQILDTEGVGRTYGNTGIIRWDRRSTSRSTHEIVEHHIAWHQNLWEKLEYIKPENPIFDDPRWVVPRRPRGMC